MADNTAAPVKHKHKSHHREGEKKIKVDLEWSDGDFCLFSFKQDATSTFEDNLHIVCCSKGSSQSEEENEKLTNLLRKLNVDTLQPGCGTVSSLYISSSIPVQFYTCLIDTHNSCHSPSKDGSCLKYILCCMSNRKKGLELFREDLDTFVEGLNDMLVKMTTNVVTQDSDVYQKIKSWTSILSYLSELIPKCHEKLPTLLHAALNNTVKIEGNDTDTIYQLQRFIDCCRVTGLMETQPHVLQLIDIGPAVDSHITITANKGDTIQISSTEINGFTRKWSKALLSQGVSEMDPFFLKKVMDDFKLMIIQDMNAFKRLVREAETDYYSLYKCYTFLQSSGNIDLLLKCSLREAEGEDEKETVSVVKTLMEFISIKNGSIKSTESIIPVQLL